MKVFGAFISSGLFEDVWDVWGVEEDVGDLGWDAYEGYARLFNMAAATDKVAATDKAAAAATCTTEEAAIEKVAAATDKVAAEKAAAEKATAGEAAIEKVPDGL